jgi:hypothetical protein
MFKYLKFIFSFLIYLFLAGNTIAQTWEITGKVTDALTRAPIQYAYISTVKDTAFAFSDADGNFTIHISKSATSLAALADGYITDTIPVKNIHNLTVFFELTANASQLASEAVSADESPVLLYVKKIIDNKDNNNPNNNTYLQYRTYEKLEFDLTDISDKLRQKKMMKPFGFIFDNVDSVSTNGKPFLPVFFTETISEVYHRSNPERKMEIVRASKSAGVENLTVIQLLKDIYRDVTIYDNYINVFGKSFISPVSYVGMKHYNYKLTDSTFINGKWCYKITFKEKKRFEPAFIGDFWFHDSTFAIQRITMHLAKDAMINFVDDFAYVKVYKNIHGNKWVPASEQLVVKFSTRDQGTSIIGRKSKYFDHVNIDDPLPDSLFKSNAYIMFDTSAYDQTNSYWRKNRPEVLTNREKDIYELVDTLKTLPAFQLYVFSVIVALTGYAEIGKFNYGPYYNIISHNGVEGARLRFGIRTNDKFSPRWMFEGFGAYGTKDGNFKYMGGIRYTITKKPFRAIGFQYRNDIVQPGLYESYFKDAGLIVTLFKHNPSDKLCRSVSNKIYFDAAIRAGLSMRLQYLKNHYSPIGNIMFSYFANDSHTLIKDDLNVSEVSLNLRFSSNERYIEKKYKRISLGSDQPVYQLNFTRGIKNFLDGDFNYTKIAGRIEDKLTLFPYGHLHYQFEAGNVFGKIPYLCSTCTAATSRGFLIILPIT